MRRTSLALVVLLAACAADDGGPAASGSSGNASSGSESGSATTPTASMSVSESGSMSASGSPTSDATAGTTSTPEDTGTADTTTGSAGRGEVRFVALGDAGEGNEAQFAVANGIGTVCAERGCDFAIYLGDNFYDNGVSSEMDAQFQMKFEVPYAALDFPFYIALGNHDYGALMNMWDQSEYEIAYTEQSDKWTLPDEYYSFQEDHVHFVALDTSRILGSQDIEAQRQWLQQDIAGLNGWIVMFGHHPYISNGDHGNAGNYEGLGAFLLGGQNVKDFFDAEICGKAQVYICGHDHTMQWLEPACGTEFIVSGAGAKNTDLVHRDDNPTHFETDQVEGFMWIEIIDNEFTGVFYDRDGIQLFERSFSI